MVGSKDSSCVTLAKFPAQRAGCLKDASASKLPQTKRTSNAMLCFSTPSVIVMPVLRSLERSRPAERKCLAVTAHVLVVVDEEASLGVGCASARLRQLHNYPGLW